MAREIRRGRSVDGLGGHPHVALEDGARFARSGLTNRVVVRSAAVAQVDQPLLAGVAHPDHAPVGSDG
jgi:hypothetical protein